MGVLHKFIIRFFRVCLLGCMDDSSVTITYGKEIIWKGRAKQIHLYRDMRNGNKGVLEIDFNEVVDDL